MQTHKKIRFFSVLLTVMFVANMSIRFVQSETTNMIPTSFDKTLEIQLPEGFIPEDHFAEKTDEKVEYAITYKPQSTIDYLVITSSSLWATFNDNFKDWKLAHDDKIGEITIVNTSDIVADTDCWVAGQYGDATNISNGNPWVEDGKEIGISYYSMFNDTQCKIRNFIRKYVCEYNTSYVLLAGNRDIVPVRMMCSYAHSGPSGSWYNNTNHAVDMYYACLNGNFNNNTNSRWGENNFSKDIYWAKVSGWDEIDWAYDVLVGRILVNTIAEANYWINKEKAYVESNTKNYLMSGLVASKDPSNNIDDWVWLQIKDEMPDMSFVNGQNISQAQWNIMDDYCNGDVTGWGGIAFMYHSGHGGTLWTPYQPSNLHNSNVPNFLYTEGCDEGDFGLSASSRTEQYMQDDGCIFAGISNSAYGWFIASTWYSEEMFRLMFNESETCFAKAHFDARENVGWELHSVAPMLFKETNFFGDPALEFNFWEIPEPNHPVIFSTPDPSNNSVNMPLNFSWNITIQDPDGDSFNWTIDCNNSQSNGMDSDTNGTKSLQLSNLSYSIIYTVWVNATDGTNTTNEYFMFKTRPGIYAVYDIIEDCTINYIDISAFVSRYREVGTPGWIREDINDDGIVNYLDLSSLVSHYRETY